MSKQLRRFSGGGPEFEVPVDALGRMRHRVTLDDLQVTRSVGDDPTVGFRGHAAVFDKRTLIGGKRWGFWEQVAPGAFQKSISEHDVRFLVNHDPTLVMARAKAGTGTMTLSEDASGLLTEAPALDLRQSYTMDVAVAMERGDVTQMSFAFEPIEWRYEQAEDGKSLYTLTEVRLWDVSVVTYPAYEQTDAGLRAHAFERMTRSLGLDEADVLERIGADDLGAWMYRQISSQPDGAGEGPGPVDATRESHRPPESTGAADQNNESALRTLAARTMQKEAI